MKTGSLKPKIAILDLLLLFVLSLAALPISAAEFSKGSKVELITDAPLTFKTSPWRIGKSGEQFTVILHQQAVKKVFLSARDSAGAEIAVSVDESQVRIAGNASESPIARKVLQAAKPEEAVLVAATKGGTGTGFLVQMNGFLYVVTNAHVARSLKAEIEFKNPTTKFSITKGFVDVADDRDLVRFSSEGDSGLFIEPAVKIDDSVFAYGNSGGEGVIGKLRGKVMGVGVDRIEISCEIIPGNSGGPVLNSQGKVVAVATYITDSGDIEKWIRKGTRFEEARRFAMRVSEDIKWTRVPFVQFQDENSKIERMVQLGEYFRYVLEQIFFNLYQERMVLETDYAQDVMFKDFVSKYNHANTPVKGLLSDLVRIVDAMRKRLATEVKAIKTPYLKKQGEEAVAVLDRESIFINERLKAIR